MYKLMTITALSLAAIPAFANQNITCISDGAFVHCNLDQADQRDITISRVISGDCLQANVWGVDSTGIWVDKNCGAVFDYTAAANTANNNTSYTNYNEGDAGYTGYNEGYNEGINYEPWYYAPWLFEPWMPYYNYYPYYGSQVFFSNNGEYHEAWHHGSHENFHGTTHGTLGTATTTHHGGMSSFHGASGHTGTSTSANAHGSSSNAHGSGATHGGGASHHGGHASHGGGHRH